MVNSEYSSIENGKIQFKAVTPILLNTKTGEAWEMMPEEENTEAGYKWIKQNRE